MNVLKKIFGDDNEKMLKELRKEVEQVNALEEQVAELSDDALRAKTHEFKTRLEGGATLDDILHEAYAVVRESAKRTLGQRHYDVQIMGGIVLHRGMISEMRTGEGKTLTSTLPIYLNALSGKGVHVVTVNDYLAKRDCVWMGQIFTFLGLTSGCIQHEGGYLYDESFKADEQDDEQRDQRGSYKIQMDFLRPAERNEAYGADITYGTNNQFGFDYLRDNMATRTEQMVQRELHYAIVDEIDSILIDEARTPLIISAPDMAAADEYYRFANLVTDLREDEHYNIDEKMRVATFTDAGIAKMEEKLGIENLYVNADLSILHHAEQALKAHALFHKDQNYVVQDSEVKIVDEFTGRIMEGRRYSEGLHQAIEAKEGVEIKRESKTLATITFQNFFRMYDKLGGMTGTAATEAEEFGKIYGLEVVVIPTNRPIARIDNIDRIYKTEKGKFLAVVEEVKKRQEKGQPTLIGTVSIEKNELMSQLLKKAGVKHEMLNAKNHEREAQIVAQAGMPGAVTLATNMAGRGVDIALGGANATDEQRQKVMDLGGLYVIGTERHESRRIDNQLRGRAGRQGDPGETQFFVSLEDDLMRIFGSDRVKSVMDTLRVDETTPIESKMITRSLEKSQERVEGYHFDSRKHVLEYDDVLNKHREAVYSRRRKMLTGDVDMVAEVKEMIEQEIERVVLFHTGDDPTSEVPDQFADKAQEGDWDPKEILEVMQTIVPLSDAAKKDIASTLKEISRDKEVLATQRTEVIDVVMNEVDARFEEAQKAFSEIDDAAPEDKKLGDRLSLALKTLTLRSIDNIWIQHLDTMRHLRRSIGLRGYAQRDPLVEYKKEAFTMFNFMMANIEREVVYNVMKIMQQAKTAQKVLQAAPSLLERARVMMSGAQKTMQRKTAAAAAGVMAGGASAKLEPRTPASAEHKVGRNEPCHCGSGKKFKRCHGA